MKNIKLLICFAGSILFLCCISLHRFLGICHPVRSLSWVSARRARLVSVAVWACVLFCQAPILYFSRTRWLNYILHLAYNWKLNSRHFASIALNVFTYFLLQGCKDRANLLWHHQSRAFWWLPGVQLSRVSDHVCLALHGGDGLLRPHGSEASGARLGV